MASLANITIPTPEPYSKQDPNKQQENYFYVFLQLLAVAKANGEPVSFNPSSSLAVDLAGVEQALRDLQYNGQVIDFGNFQIRLEGKAEGVSI